MNRELWVWMPHPAHFTGADKCQFRLATWIGPEPGFIVATIGEWFPKGDNEREVGINRTYETMVFPAKKNRKKSCCPYEISDLSEIEAAGYNDPASAYNGHLAMCEKWSNPPTPAA